MKILRQCLTFLLVFLLAYPAWSESDIVGSAVLSQSARVRDVDLTAGSTLYSGDSVSVNADGDARISLVGGDQLEVLGSGGVSLARERSGVEFMVDRGTALFHTVAASSLQAVLGDATIRSLGGPAIGLIRMDSPDSAVVVASSGKLSISTAHDGNTVVLNEGDGARVTLLPPSQNQGPIPSGKGPFLTPKRLAIIALIVGGGLLAGLLIVAHHEHKPNIVREITPFAP